MRNLHIAEYSQIAGGEVGSDNGKYERNLQDCLYTIIVDNTQKLSPEQLSTCRDTVDFFDKKIAGLRIEINAFNLFHAGAVEKVRGIVEANEAGLLADEL